MKDIENLCKRSIIINNGEIIFDGELKKVNDYFSSKKIIKLHLGKSIEENVLKQFGFIKEINLVKEAGDIILYHHERYDGQGYPDGLKAEEIPLLSRILSVADVYDALTTDRSYRKKMADDVAAQIIKENAGSQFDPKIVEIFLALHSQGEFSI